MRSVSRFVPRFDALESVLCLSDLLSNPATGTWLSTSTTTQTTIQTVTVPLTTTVQPQLDSPLLIAAIDGTMPTTPGVNLDIYPPAMGYAAPGIPQVPVSPQDPSDIFAPFNWNLPLIPPGTPNPAPYYPPPYGIPTYVTLSNMSVKPVT